MHNTVWKWLGEKMDSLRTDGMSAKSHLLWMQEDISDSVRTWETSDMFFTPSTICCGGVVLDYFSVLMIINEILTKQYEAERLLNLLWIFFFLSIHFILLLLTSIITRPFTKLYVWSKPATCQIWKRVCCDNIWNDIHHMHDFFADITYINLSAYKGEPKRYRRLQFLCIRTWFEIRGRRTKWTVGFFPQLRKLSLPFSRMCGQDKMAHDHEAGVNPRWRKII